MEVDTERLVKPAAEHETDAVDDAFSAELEQFQPIPPSLDNSAFDQTNKVSTFAYIIQDIVHQIFDHLHVFHIYLVAFEHVICHKLRRKGIYFSEPVNSFV